MEKSIDIELSGCGRGVWLSDIIKEINLLEDDLNEVSINLIFPEDIDVEKFEPFHIVVLSCFLEHATRCGCKHLNIEIPHGYIVDFMADKLKIHKYFQKIDPSNHEDATDETILNLWKVVNNMTYAYSLSVSNYFNSKFFKGFDTSGLTSALNEVYANIADHSQSNGNAFSYISYNPDKRKIYIAACDFGLGIPTTLANSGKSYKDDSDALRDSVNIGVTSGSTKGNKGMGLDNILSTITSDDNFRIISNKSLLACFGNKNNIKTYNLDFDFKGTLIYFELSTDSFPLKDIEEEIMIS